MTTASKPAISNGKALVTLLAVAAIVPTLVMSVRVLELTALVPGNLLPQSEVPLWALVLHGGASVLFLLLGAFQILPGFRARHQRLHRAMGRYLVGVSVIGAVSGLWITLAWPGISGPILFWGRLAAGLFWIFALWRAIVAIRLRDFATHGRWMLRAYGLALTAGTLPFLLLPFISIFGEGNLVMEEIIQVAGWVVNIVLIEWLVGRTKAQNLKRRLQAAAA